MSEMDEIALRMVARGKGILAADESSGTIAKRFASIEVESTEEKRREYRELLFRSNDALRECISGVILFDETLRQNAGDGTPLVDVIRGADVLAGIKVDQGLAPIKEGGIENFTNGLEGLPDRLKEYRELGAVFTKWRAVFHIGESMPSQNAITRNADLLAKYAKCCQQAGLVPIVEPEVLMEGNHDIDSCSDASTSVLHEVFGALEREGVRLEAVVLKPNMVTPGDACARRATSEEIAEKTLACFHKTVPAAVPGIAFLSGGQKDVEATENLNAINALANASGKAPWALTFSFGRALQAGALQAWGGEEANIPAAQAEFHKRAQMNSKASLGEWSASIE